MPGPPRSFAWAERRVETSCTPGTLRATAAAPAGIGEKPLLLRITN